MTDTLATCPPQTRICPGGQLFDPFFRTCRSVVCPSGMVTSKGRCVSGAPAAVLVPAQTARPAQAGGGRDHDHGDHHHHHHHPETGAAVDAFDACPKFLLEPSEFEMSDDGLSATVKAYNRTFAPGEFKLTRDARLEICAYSSGIEFVDKFGPYMG